MSMSSRGGAFGEQFNPYSNIGRKDLSPSGPNPPIGSSNLASAFSSNISSSNSSKMGYFGAERDKTDVENDSFYGGKGFSNSREPRELSSQMGGLNLYNNDTQSNQSNLPTSSTAIGSQNQSSGFFGGSNSMLSGQGFNKSKEQNDRSSSPSWGWSQSDPNADLWNRPTIGSNTSAQKANSGFSQGFNSPLPNLPPASSRSMSSSSLSQQFTSHAQSSFAMSPSTQSNDLISSFSTSKILPRQSSPGLLSMSGQPSLQQPSQQQQQQQQQQRSVIGQIPQQQQPQPQQLPSSSGPIGGAPGLSPSNSPGPLGLTASGSSKLPVASRSVGMPQQQALPASAVGAAAIAPNIVSSMASAAPGFIGSQFQRSLSSSSGGQAGGMGLNQGLLGSVIQPSDGSSLQSSIGSIGSIGSGLGTGAAVGGPQPLQQPRGSGGNFDQDFPALANRAGNLQNSRTGPSNSFSFVMASANKGGLDGSGAGGGQEFQIHNEDFPALPGSVLTATDDGTGLPSGSHPAQLFQHQDSKDSTGSDNYRGSSYEQILKDGRLTADKKGRNPVSGIQTSSSGVITNIPAGMVTDQFGMIGLLTFIRAAETEPNLVTLAVGSDLTTLGLNLNSTENLYHTFGSPFSDSPCKPHEIDFYAPHEYLISPFIRDKLATIKLGRYGEDLLFYLYYTNCGDIMQLAAAAELYARDWRYHKDERVWITRFPGQDPQVKTNTYERGTYYYFDSQGWRKVAKEFHVEYDRLEAKPTAQALQQPPAGMTGAGQQSQPQAGVQQQQQQVQQQSINVV